MLGRGDGDVLEFVGGGDGGIEEPKPERALKGGFEAVELVGDGAVLDEVEGLGCAQVAGDGEGTEGEAETGEEVQEGLGLVAWGLWRGVGGVRRGGVLAGDAGVAARGGRGEDGGHGKWQVSK